MLPFKGILETIPLLIYIPFNFHIFFSSKTIKDTAIIALIPQLRETLSQLLYKVQAALVGYNCSSIFWAGNLKNKDLEGDEILSQVRIISTFPWF